MRLRTRFLTGWLLAGGLGLTSLHAQQSVQAAGGEASGPGGSISYSVGQVAYLSASGPGGSLLPGSQQPYEVFVLSSTSPVLIALDISTFPNPTQNALTLQVDAAAVAGLTWHLADLLGRPLQSHVLAKPLTPISLAEYPAGTYLLTVRRRMQALKTFKIIKY